MFVHSIQRFLEREGVKCPGKVRPLSHNVIYTTIIDNPPIVPLEYESVYGCCLRHVMSPRAGTRKILQCVFGATTCCHFVCSTCMHIPHLSCCQS